MTACIVFKSLAIISLALQTTLSIAAPALPYDETANAKTELQAGLTSARQQQKPLLIIFGANWCPDCRALGAALNGRVGKLIDEHFVVVKVDIGNFDKNMELSEHYGTPTKKGIPAAVVVGADDSVLYATKAGELANARRMSDSGLYDFFRSVIAGL